MYLQFLNNLMSVHVDAQNWQRRRNTPHFLMPTAGSRGQHSAAQSNSIRR